MPEPSSAKWGNKTVTLAYDAVFNVEWSAQIASLYFANGYAVFEDLSAVSETGELCFNAIGYSGNRLFDKTYGWLSHFDQNGVAVIKKTSSDEYMYVNTKGEEYGSLSSDEATAWEEALVPDILGADEMGMTAVPTDSPWDDYYAGSLKIDKYSNVYNGLFAFVVADEAGGKSRLGIMDTDLNVVIQPTYELATNPRHTVYISEDRIVVEYDNKIAVLMLTVE